MSIFKNHPRRIVSRKPFQRQPHKMVKHTRRIVGVCLTILWGWRLGLSNLENVLQKNLRTGKPRECIFRASGGTNFENLPILHQPWWRFGWFLICTSLPKKTLDTPFFLRRS